MLFAQFWAAYPRKTGKPDAARAFAALKVTPELLALILTGLAKWKAHPRWIKDHGQFIKTPGPWLCGRMWEDEEVCGRAGAADIGWWVAAGFDNAHEAGNEGCHAHNAAQFRDGKRVEAA